MNNLLSIYLGGVIALLFESIVQWLHPVDTPFKESLPEALVAAFIWPVMSIFAICELLFSKRDDSN